MLGALIGKVQESISTLFALVQRVISAVWNCFPCFATQIAQQVNVTVVTAPLPPAQTVATLPAGAQTAMVAAARSVDPLPNAQLEIERLQRVVERLRAQIATLTTPVVAAPIDPAAVKEGEEFLRHVLSRVEDDWVTQKARFPICVNGVNLFYPVNMTGVMVMGDGTMFLLPCSSTISLWPPTSSKTGSFPR